MPNPNWFYLGLGIWLIGDGIDGRSPGAFTKMVGGLIVVLVAFLGA